MGKLGAKLGAGHVLSRVPGTNDSYLDSYQRAPVACAERRRGTAFQMPRDPLAHLTPIPQ